MSQPAPGMVSAVERGRHAEVGAVLGRAFEDDPLWSVVFVDDRLPKLISMFEALSKATLAAGGTVEITPGISGAALWMPPGAADGLWSTVRSGLALPRFTIRLPVRDRKLMLAMLSQFDDRRKILMPSPHWYLAAVGTDPSRRGEGLGSALVQAGMRRADLDGRPIYLETETESNVRFYERLGFHVIEETVASGLELPVWLMSRSPRT